MKQDETLGIMLWEARMKKLMRKISLKASLRNQTGWHFMKIRQKLAQFDEY